MKLSIVIPVFNEKETLEELLNKVENALLPREINEKEIILVDDFSTDGTRNLLKKIDESHIKKFYHKKNWGKGAALRTGFENATGDIVLIQDADLEYNPDEYPKLLKPILDGKADVVYGSRFVGGDAHRILYFWHSIGNKFLTLCSNMFSDLNLTDMETCYKVFRKDIIDKIEIEENRFGFEPEVTAKLGIISKKESLRIYEIGISYYGRTYEEGKKIGVIDGFRALWCILKYNTSTLANLVKYTIMGVIITVFQILNMVFLVEVFGFRSQANLKTAHAISIEASIIVAFFLHSVVTWRQKYTAFGEIIKFFLYFHAANTISFILRVILFSLLIDKTELSYIIIALIGIAITFIFNFYGYNWIVFKRTETVKK